MMDTPTGQFFDKWAEDGSAERMEQHHAYPTSVAFERVTWQPDWQVLDVGCGNGWATRAIAERLPVGSVVGIELSAKMAERAANLSAERANISILQVHLFDPRLEAGSFDLIHACESLYYIQPIEKAVAQILALLRPGGQFIGVVDYYQENTASHVWSETVTVPMSLLSESAYAERFTQCGFQSVTVERVRHPHATEPDGRWQETEGSLLIRAERGPEK